MSIHAMRSCRCHHLTGDFETNQIKGRAIREARDRGEVWHDADTCRNWSGPWHDYDIKAGMAREAKSKTMACYNCAGQGKCCFFGEDAMHSCPHCDGTGRRDEGIGYPSSLRMQRHDQTTVFRKWDLSPEEASLQARLKWDRRRRQRGKATWEESLDWATSHLSRTLQTWEQPYQVDAASRPLAREDMVRAAEQLMARGG